MQSKFVAIIISRSYCRQITSQNMKIRTPIILNITKIIPTIDLFNETGSVLFRLNIPKLKLYGGHKYIIKIFYLT